MKKLHALCFSIGLILTPAFVHADEPKVAAADAAPTVEVNNKICPVSHEDVNKDGNKPYKMTYHGKTYNLCCDMCVKDFNKDPDKYVKIIDDQMKSGTN